MKRLLVGLTVLLAACSAPESGRIDAKSHQPAHYNDWVQYICAAYSPQGFCTVNVPIFHHDYVPDKWFLKIINKDDEGWAEVPEEEFNNHEVGGCWRTESC